MDWISDEQLRALLGHYEVSGPSPALLALTRRRMRGEMLLVAQPVKGQSGMLLTLSALAILVTLNMFYVATVGTLLKLFLPRNLDVYLNQSMLGISVAAAAMLMGMVLVVFFKTMQVQKSAQIRVRV